jgi:C_GCAxxG_C_C family probable redox protein
MTTSEQLEVHRTLARRAGMLLRTGYHCSESVVLGVGPYVVRDWTADCARLSTGFAGGVGGTQNELCGALAGGVMIIGALFGRSDLSDDALAQRLARTFRERYWAAFEGTECRWLRENVVLPVDGLGACDVMVEQTTMILLGLLEEAGVRLSAN